MIGGDRTILLVDDHAVVREGYRAVLQKQPGLRVVAEAGNGAEAYKLFKATRPDLVIMDLTMPGVSGIEGIRHIREWDRDARILVFTMHQNAAFALQAIRAGARGYVTKMSPPETLLRAVAEVLGGHIALSPDIDHELALNRLAEEANAADILSAREFEVLALLLAERSTDEIAGLLNLSPKTVANLHSLIKSKLGVDSDIELVRLALRQGLMELKAG
ncbi:response regulator [Dongia sp.]|uniref:response regulator n=1 Tax=Dongia sp. TaxID=1977262 RepID=UPI003750A318